MSFPINGANWWCRKNHQWATQSLHTPDKNLHNAKAEDLKRSTGVVPAKYPPMVKLEKSLVHNSRVSELGGNCAYLNLWGFWGFYSSVGPKSKPWSRSSFLIGENLFNPCIFRNPFPVGVFLIRGKRGAQDIFLYTHAWRPSKAMSDSSEIHISPSVYSFQLTVFSLLSPTYYLQLTVFNLLYPRCSRQVWGGAVDFTTKLSLISEDDNLVMSVAFCFIMG